MNSLKNKDIKASDSPIVKAIVMSVIKNLRYNNTSLEVHKERTVIDTEIVPKLSKKIPSVINEDFASISRKNPVISKEEKTKMITPISFKPINKPIKKVIQKAPPRLSSKPVADFARRTPQNTFMPRAHFVPSGNMEVRGNYGPLDGLIKDPSVSSIECQGEGKPLYVVQSGQKLRTKISLTEEQIMDLLEQIADDAMVPLLEGVFRAAVDNFTINAVISDMIGSRFVIKKQTPYAMLE